MGLDNISKVNVGSFQSAGEKIKNAAMEYKLSNNPGYIVKKMGKFLEFTQKKVTQ